MAHEEFEAEEKQSGVLKFLEFGDGFAHFAVSILLLLLALVILITSTWGFVADLIHNPTLGTLIAPERRNAGVPPPPDTVTQLGLRYLSDLLFGVIVLELLSTLLTYIKARKLEATIKDFIVVAIISSIRKILLVGAQSSMGASTGDDFIKEALGTLITIGGIILLIGGFLFLNHYRKPASLPSE